MQTRASCPWDDQYQLGWKGIKGLIPARGIVATPSVDVLRCGGLGGWGPKFGRCGPVVVFCPGLEGRRGHLQDVCRAALPVRDGKDQNCLLVLPAGKGEHVPPRGS